MGVEALFCHGGTEDTENGGIAKAETPADSPCPPCLCVSIRSFPVHKKAWCPTVGIEWPVGFSRECTSTQSLLYASFPIQPRGDKITPLLLSIGPSNIASVTKHIRTPAEHHQTRDVPQRIPTPVIQVRRRIRRTLRLGLTGEHDSRRPIIGCVDRHICQTIMTRQGGGVFVDTDPVTNISASIPQRGSLR